MVVMKLVVKVSSEKRRRRQLFPTPAKEEEEEEIHVHFRLHRSAQKKLQKIKALQQQSSAENSLTRERRQTEIHRYRT